MIGEEPANVAGVPERGFEGFVRDVMRECSIAFWRGATRPSLASLLIALAMNVTIAAALCVFVTPRTIAHKYGFLMAHDLDTHAMVTGKALALQSSQDLSHGSVLVLGSSTTIRCVTSEQRLADLIREKTGQATAVHDMCTDAQCTWEMAAIVDCLPSEFAGVLVVGITPGLLSFGLSKDEDAYSSLAAVIERPRLGFISKALDEEARLAGLAVPSRTGVYIWDNRHFFLARRKQIARNLLRGPPTYGEPLHADWVSFVNRQEFWDKELAALPSIIERYGKNAARNLSVIRRLLVNLRKRSRASFVLLVSPIHPGWYALPDGAEFHTRYLDDLRRFARDNTMSFLNISDQADLTTGDFVDYEGHIGNQAARERCTKALAASVSNLLSGSTFSSRAHR